MNIVDQLLNRAVHMESIGMQYCSALYLHVATEVETSINSGVALNTRHIWQTWLNDGFLGFDGNPTTYTE